MHACEEGRFVRRYISCATSCLLGAGTEAALSVRRTPGLERVGLIMNGNRLIKDGGVREYEYYIGLGSDGSRLIYCYS